MAPMLSVVLPAYDEGSNDNELNELWLDSNGLVRKLSLEISATGPGSSESGDASIAFELWDYGEDVEIALPPASQVVDASYIRS